MEKGENEEEGNGTSQGYLKFHMLGIERPLEG